MMQSAPGFLLHLRLFLEGIEVPVIGASVSASIGGAATANIDIVPGDLVDLLLPRTTVHLFYLDYIAFKNSGLSSPTPSYYKILFAGELFSITSSKVGVGSRSVTLNCMDFSNVLDTSFIYSMTFTGEDNTNNSIVSNSSRFLATLDSDIDNIINSPSEVIRQLSQLSPSGSVNQGQLSVLGGLLSIIERLVGIQGQTYGVNAWTTIHERRVRLTESIISDSGETAAKVFDASQFSDWLKNRVGSSGDVISFRKLIDIVLEYIFYSFVPNPVAKYIPGVSATKPGYPNRDIPEFTIPLADPEQDVTLAEFKKNAAANLNLDPTFAAFAAEVLSSVDRTIRGTVATAGNLKGGPAEVFITSAFRGSEGDEARTAHERGLAIDVRFRYLDNDRVKKAGIIEGLDASALGPVEMPYFPNTTGGTLQPVPKTGTWYLRLRTALYKLSQNSTVSIKTLEQLKSAIQADSSVFASVYNSEAPRLVSDTIIAEDWQTFAAILKAASRGKVDSLLEIGRGSKQDPLFSVILGIGNDPVHIQSLNVGTNPQTVESVRLTNAPITPRERLHSFVMRPDVWFVSPPRSNVIFPDMLQSFSAQREMLRETSRLKLTLGYEFAEGSAVTNRTYFAPQIEGKKSLTLEGIDSAESIMIYDHEKYSGIVPKFDRMIDTIFYIKKDGGEGEGGTADSTGDITQYAPKVAHFYLLSERYKARAASAALTFSPNIICGFPAVVLDQTITSEEAGETTDRLNRSFKIGMVESVTHSISQGGAQTQIRLSHVRSHRTGDQTDDLFMNIVNNVGTLKVQDPAQADVFAAEGLFVPAGLVTRLGARSDLDFGHEAIAATFNASSFRELLRNAAIYEVLAGSPVIDIATIPLAGESYDASAPGESKVIGFKRTPYRNYEVNSGVWQGEATLAWITTVTTTEDPGDIEDTDDTGVSISLSPPNPTQIVLTLDSEAAIPLTRFFVTVGTQRFSYMPIVLPGNKFQADIPKNAEVGGRVLPVEESIRPLWISDSYGNEKITRDIYGPFFGTTAIVDDVENTRFLVKSIEEAVDSLAKRYAREVAKTGTYSADIAPDPMTWINDYTRRDIATFPEILATKDQRLDTKLGAFVARDGADTTALPEDSKYYGGFHSNAVNFGDLRYGEKLEFLDIVGAGLQHTGHSGGKDPFEIDKDEGIRLDPRKERAERVKKYKANIDGDAALGVNSVTGIGKRG